MRVVRVFRRGSIAWIVPYITSYMMRLVDEARRT
jgi:hypothetical protein